MDWYLVGFPFMSEMTIRAGFEVLADKFFDLTKKQPSGGAALCVYHNGHPIIDIWDGEASPGTPWKAESNVLVFSTTKGLLSILAHRAIEQGLIDINEKVSKYWPEFGCNGKENITVEMVMRHRSGLSAPREDLTFDDVLALQPVLDALARQSPIWEPDSGFAYHSISFGHLLGRIVSGATGMSIRDLMKRDISQPLNVPAWIGISPDVEVPIARLITDTGPAAPIPAIDSDAYWMERAFSFGGALKKGLTDDFESWNDPRIYQAEIAGAGGVTNARAIAKIYSATVVETDSIRLLQDKSIMEALNHRNPGDNIWGDPQPHPVHSLGFMVANPQHSPVLSDSTFGHEGLGGQQGFADLENRIGFGYVTNWVPLYEDGMKRHRELTRVLKSCLAEL